MEIEGRIRTLLPLVSDTSKQGNPYRKQDFIVEYFQSEDSIMPNTILLSVMNDRIDQLNLQEGDIIKVRFAINTHEYNGRIFNDIRTGMITVVKRNETPAAAPVTPQEPAAPVAPQEPQPQPQGGGKNDDLPFRLLS